VGSRESDRRKKILDKKWKALEKLGYTRPKDGAENKRRLQQSRGEI